MAHFISLLYGLQNPGPFYTFNSANLRQCAYRYKHSPLYPILQAKRLKAEGKMPNLLTGRQALKPKY